MATAAQITANHANSALSTGPITAEGKSTAAANSLKHGLTSKRIVVKGEDPAAFEELRASLHAEYAPATTTEAFLVDQIAQNSWRLERARRVETASLTGFLPEESADIDEGLAIAFYENAKAFDNLRRYEAAIERAYYKAIKQLRELQAERRVQTPPIGSVSQKVSFAPLASLAIKNPAPEIPKSYKESRQSNSASERRT